MRFLALLIASLAYLNLSFLIWALLSLNHCNSNDGCLGFVWYFWVGCVVAVAITFVGIVVWQRSRKRGVNTGFLPIALGVLCTCVAGFLTAAILLRT